MIVGICCEDTCQTTEEVTERSWYSSKLQLTTNSGLKESLVTFTVDECKTNQDNKNVFWKNIFYSIPDAIIAGVTETVLQAQLHRDESRSSTSSQSQLLHVPVSGIYKSTVNDLRHGLHRAKMTLERKKESKLELAVFFRWGVP